ncbi:hypothetical protein [Ruminiclostridium josui]|uniref:hypothetical protein n=1 Tax=Ruminiclostridium josui TaxID=1499 RepID=UPI000B0FE1CE|nr:hypothetical protein [Ruminiclostridium josui]
MLEITTWMDDFLLALQKNFSHRVWFVGLQGSYGRGEASDLFQFYNDTKPIKGSLDELLPKIDANAIDRAIKIGTCNIYHDASIICCTKRIMKFCEDFINLHPLLCRPSLSRKLENIQNI